MKRTVLGILQEEGAMTSGQIADRLCTTSWAVSGCLRILRAENKVRPVRMDAKKGHIWASN